MSVSSRPLRGRVGTGKVAASQKRTMRAQESRQCPPPGALHPRAYVGSMITIKIEGQGGVIRRCEPRQTAQGELCPHVVAR